MSEHARLQLRSVLDADPDVAQGSLRAETDQHLSIGRDVWRLRWRNQVTVAVDADAGLATTCGALLDALAVREVAHEHAPGSIDDGTVNVLIHRPPPSARPTETEQALRSLREAVQGLSARLWYHDGASWIEDVESSPTWDVDDTRLHRWLDELLLPRLTAKPTTTALALIDAVDDPAMHLYPSEITSKCLDRWAIRADGLQIGVARGSTITLGIGKEGKSRAIGAQRAAFIDVFGSPTVAVSPSADPASGALDVGQAAQRIRVLLGLWRPPGVEGAPIAHRTKAGVPFVDEHTMEARLLKGLIALGDEHAGLIADDHLVARGSQFPTLWATGEDTRARYLDAMLCSDEVPLLVELKVGTGGQGRYYRRSLAQVALYRHFVHHAPALDPWFHAAGLNRRAAAASVAVPTPKRWTKDFERRFTLLRRVGHRLAVGVHLIDNTMGAPELVGEPMKD